MKETSVSAWEENSANIAAKLTPVKGLLMLGFIVLVIGAYIGMNYALGITDIWAAFLFVLYWMGIEQMNMQKLPRCAIGAAVGLFVAYALFALPKSMGSMGNMIVLVGVLALIYCQIMGWLLIAVNMTTMLYLTVSTIPQIQIVTTFPKLITALLVGVVFFPGLVWIGSLLTQRTASKANI